MKCQILKSLLLVSICTAAWAQVDQSFDSEKKACAALAPAAATVDSAELIQPPFTVTEKYGPKEHWKIYTVNVQFCRVIGKLKPEPKSEIDFELWLPRRTSWNGKFEGVGAGGSTGTIVYRDLMRGLIRSYAVIATDNGHSSTEGSDVTWALGHPERVIDFGYRAEHVVTQAGKDLTKWFYGQAPKYSYFFGCSQGGHHGLMEAQRFPEDYDGIIAGAPVYSWTNEMVDQAWNVRSLQQIPSHALSKEALALLDKSVTKACAGPDRLIADPRQCSFNPAILLCNTANSGQCLTAQEVEAVRQMYSGPKTSAGVQLSPGLARGGETAWDRLWTDPKHLGGSWQGVFRYMVFDDPTWDLPRMNFDHDPEVARKKLAATLNPDNPDLSRFAKHGGKLIVYHGWADDMVPSETSVNYFNSVVKILGTTKVNDFYRLFMVPGMAHCGGGPGANVLFQSEVAPNVPLESDRDVLTALEHWVEKGEAPERLVASRTEQDGKITRTRLVCPYPSIAVYSGTGDPLQAQRWTCSK
jgi:Tannase and feruloyl esterase